MSSTARSVRPVGSPGPDGGGSARRVPDPGAADRVSADELEALVERAAAELGNLPDSFPPMRPEQWTRIVETMTRIESMAVSGMCNLTAGMADPDTDPAEALRLAGRIPGREAKRRANIGKQLTGMPEVRERFAKGDITPDHAAAIAAAADKVGPDLVNDDNRLLLDAAGRLSPESFSRHTRRWSDRKLAEQGIDPHERQRRAREAKTWVEQETGLGVLMAKLPRPQYDRILQAVDSHYLHHLRKHPDTDNRAITPKQRTADVIYELITNRDARTGEPLTPTPGIRARAAVQLIIVARMAVIDGTDPTGTVDLNGTEPVPRSILRTLSPDTLIAGMLYNHQGQPIYLGQSQRLANAAQRLAVAVRDGGCFKCGAPMHRCELHHIKEWHRDQGPTDIDNLVAVCRKHHQWIQNNNLQVHHTKGGYQTQPRNKPPP